MRSPSGWPAGVRRTVVGLPVNSTTASPADTLGRVPGNGGTITNFPVQRITTGGLAGCVEEGREEGWVAGPRAAICVALAAPMGAGAAVAVLYIVASRPDAARVDGSEAPCVVGPVDVDWSWRVVKSTSIRSPISSISWPWVMFTLS